MSTLVPLTSKNVTLQGFQLTANTDMLTALTYLNQLSPSQGYIGSVAVQSDGTWFLSISQQPQNINQTAYINDWIILKNGTTATVCPAANFASFYTQG